MQETLEAALQNNKWITLTDSLSNNVVDGAKVFKIDVSKIHNKETLLKELYTGLGFDDYARHANYDGLEELLQPDLWDNTPSLVIRIAHAQQLEELDPKTLQTLLLVFKDTSERWAKMHHDPRAFRVELSMSTSTL